MRIVPDQYRQSQGESRGGVAPHALAELCRNRSTHTAPVIRLLAARASSQRTTASGFAQPPANQPNSVVVVAIVVVGSAVAEMVYLRYRAKDRTTDSAHTNIRCPCHHNGRCDGKVVRELMGGCAARKGQKSPSAANQPNCVAGGATVVVGSAVAEIDSPATGAVHRGRPVPLRRCVRK